ncbi:hypothetical protein [Arenimonas terrae]|uniref:Uncharacterized protein n=1 Tax=Arenimonas terrae TaxID=2546226 RepID=A0A5C4RQZ9_9GAMM|nr:hypothetical protein [Arenimonas terrae]TNJ33231.1 hypothetical protein E1B00_13105 [Arenimonas terrae]
MTATVLVGPIDLAGMPDFADLLKGPGHENDVQLLPPSIYRPIAPYGSGRLNPAPMAAESGQEGFRSHGAELAPQPIALTQMPPGEFKLHLACDAGRSEMVVRPWRLMASGGLELRTNGVEGSPCAELRATAPSSGQSMAAAAGRSQGTELAAPLPPAVAVAGTAGGVVDVSMKEEPAGMSEQTPVETVLRSGAAEWPMRWLRWIERVGRDATVWVRDFRIGEREKDALVDGIRKFSGEVDRPLQRIVINGREHWPKPDRNNTKETQ